MINIGGEYNMLKLKKSILYVIIFVLIAGLSLSPCFGDQSSTGTEESRFKVVGYYSGSLFDEPISSLQTDKLTHVIYAFLIPQADGSLVPLEKPNQLRELTAQAHRDGAEVFIALGGWSYQGKPLVSVFETVAASDETRAALVKNACAFIQEYQLDGLELDWEHPNQGSIGNYEKLVVDLKAALNKEGKELTAALNGAWSTTAGPEVSKLMTDTCLDSFNFINVMAYDMNNAEHSPLWFANTSIDYWLARGVPREKIVLGMPLYARPSWKQYRHLAAENPEYAYQDYAATTPLESYYNGLNTLREKTYIAMKKAGGVMLFDVNEDLSDERSVVSMIHDLKGRTEGYSLDELKRHITVILDDRELVFNKEEGYGVPFIDANGRTMLPMNKSLKTIGAEVTYDETTKTVTAMKDGITVRVVIGESSISINGKVIPMDTTAVIANSRTYIPLRSVFSAFGYDVQWHSASNTAYIAKEPLPAISTWRKEIISDKPKNTLIRYFTAKDDGTEMLVLELKDMTEEHDLDGDGEPEIVVYLQGDKRNIGIYDLVSGELEYLDAGAALEASWTEYTGNIGNISSEFSNCIEAGFEENGVSGRYEIYRYENGSLTYLCLLEDALIK